MKKDELLKKYNELKAKHQSLLDAVSAFIALIDPQKTGPETAFPNAFHIREQYLPDWHGEDCKELINARNLIDYFIGLREHKEANK